MEPVGQALILAKQVADFPGAHADIAGRHVGIRADMAEQLGHKALAEPPLLRGRICPWGQSRRRPCRRRWAGRSGIF